MEAKFKPLFCFQRVDIVYLDFSKAFHRVSHSLLLEEAYLAWQSRQVVCVEGGELTGSAQRVVVKSSFPNWQSDTSGVSQGLILGLMLFNDLSEWWDQVHPDEVCQG